MNDLYKAFTEAKDEARKTISRPYDTEGPEGDQDVNVWVNYHTQVEKLGLRILARKIWNEGDQAGAKNPYEEES